MQGVSSPPLLPGIASIIRSLRTPDHTDRSMAARSTADVIDFLLESLLKLSDTVVSVRDQLQVLEQRHLALEESQQALGQRQLDLEDQARLIRQVQLEVPALPMRPGTEERPVPTLNLPLDKVVEVYLETPGLLAPFARPCALSARSLDGSLEAVELEVIPQGNYWMLELQEESCWLFPRPGLLERPSQLPSLERLFTIEQRRPLPADLVLLAPARALASEQGRRWVLQESGILSMQLDQLRQPLVRRLADLEQRLARLEMGASAIDPTP